MLVLYVINSLISELKSELEWADLGDYYLAMKYVNNMVYTGFSPEMNVAIGMQMMLALVDIGNEYAHKFLTATAEF